MQKILIIQTAFIGDVVLATGLIEKLHQHFPKAEIDFLLRKGNESLLAGHPYLHEVLIWDKKKNKQRNLFRMLLQIRKRKYGMVVNVQRFAATGLLTAFSGAGRTIGFDKNPFSFLFSKRIGHLVSREYDALHEIDRNQALIRELTDDHAAPPRLYPTREDEDKIKPYKLPNFITVSPASVWFTKQYPAEKWISWINRLPVSLPIYLLGASSDLGLCDQIIQQSGERTIINLAGKLSFLQSAALMKGASMNYVNDSAPMHFASAMNAPVTAVYCSTVPSFGFGPLSDRRFIVEIRKDLNCRPCGLHGYKACPLGHFNCAHGILDDQLMETLKPI